jgi:hypothetical protein
MMVWHPDVLREIRGAVSTGTSSNCQVWYEIFAVHGMSKYTKNH